MSSRQTLGILTWNVHGCVGTDRRLDVDRVADVISTSGADIVALQEVDCRARLPSGLHQLDRLAARTGLDAVAGPTRREQGGFFGNALLTNHILGELAHIDVTVEGREPRGIMHARLRIGTTPLEVFNTHFGLRRAERARQVERLLDVARRPTGATVVVLGDFNEWRSRAAALVQLRAAFGPLPAPRTFPSRLPVFALDRIWVRPANALTRLEALDLPLARRASDHLPVYAEVTF